MHHVPGLFLLVAELTQAFRGHGVRGGARISGAIPGSDLFRDSPNCALPGGTSRIGRPPQYRHPGHNPMTVEQRSSATVISTSMAPATGPTDSGWAGVPSARIGGASRPFDEDNNFLVW